MQVCHGFVLWLVAPVAALGVDPFADDPVFGQQGDGAAHDFSALDHQLAFLRLCRRSQHAARRAARGGARRPNVGGHAPL